MLEHPDPPSAIVCDSDVLAVGVYKAARELRRMIPCDLSVVGFDDGIIARTVDPELTTVTIPTTRVGEQALLLLLAALGGVDVPSETTLPLELTTRGSTQAMHSTPRVETKGES
jgi:DNA-binding LacI/PurR family transcriptional regulator